MEQERLAESQKYTERVVVGIHIYLHRNTINCSATVYGHDDKDPDQRSDPATFDSAYEGSLKLGNERK